MALPPDVRRDRWEDPDRRRDVSAEIEFHLQTRIEELVARGVSPSAARERALAEFGPIAPVTADCNRIHQTREVRMSRIAFLRGFGIELKAMVRGLIRAPAFALLAIGTFALGIGATTAVSSLLDGVLVKRLPYLHRDRVLRLWEQNLAQGYFAGQLTIADVRDFAEQARRFDGFAAWRLREAAVSDRSGDVVQLGAAEVTARFFDLLGVRPALGRTFAAGDDVERRGELIVLSHRTWKTYFGADPDVVGKTVRVNGGDRTVIGVLGPEFIDPISAPTAIWFANDFDALYRDPGRSRRMHFLAGIARLAPGVTLAEGRAELATIAASLAKAYPDQNTGHTAYLLPIQEAGVTQVRPMLLLVLAAVGCLLLITCANLANLVFARALARVREFAVRSALGAGRWRIVRQVIVEQLTLALAGGGIGLGLAAALVAAGRRGLVGLIPRIDRVAIDGRTFTIALGLAIVAGILSGLIPALLAVSPAVNRTVGLTSRAGLSARAVRSRDFLVAVQAALASFLLVGAGLTAKSMRRLLSEDLGFETERIWTFAIPLRSNRYQTPVAIDQFRVGVLDRIRAIPGVLAVGTAYSVPMDNRSTTSLLVENQPVPAGPPPEVGYNAADAGYFRTIGIPLREGRLFDQRDRADGRPVVVVNQALARRFFPGRSPIGARVRSGPNPNDPWLEIVGVIGDIRREARAVAPAPELYYPLSQDPTPYPSYVVKVADDPALVLARIRLAVKEQDPEVPMASVAPLETVVGQSVNRPRAVAGALFGFALLALATSAIGIYGVISFLVAERQREIAVRLAVGATASQVLVQTTRRGLAPMVLGLVAGLGASLLLRSVVRGFLYQVAPVDPGTYGLVIGAVLLAALLGALVPAVRAARLPPALVLRD